MCWRGYWCSSVASLHEVGANWRLMRSWAWQARWPDESPLLMLPGLDGEAVARLQRSGGWGTLPDLLRALHGASRNATLKMLRQELGTKVLRICASTCSLYALHASAACALSGDAVLPMGSYAGQKLQRGSGSSRLCCAPCWVLGFTFR